MKNISGDKPITAIPTVYNGVQMRSRMEAKCAYLLDKLGWQWEYEPFSIMLDGTNYMPDFYIRDLKMVVECRGYDSEKGRSQIKKFREHVISGSLVPGREIELFVVIGPDETSIHGASADDGELWVALCNECWKWIPYSQRKWACQCGNRSSGVFGPLNVSEGEIYFNSVPSPEWESLPWTAASANRQSVLTMFEKSKAMMTLAGLGDALGYLFCDDRLIENSADPSGLGIRLRLRLPEEDCIRRVVGAALLLGGLDPRTFLVIVEDTPNG